MAAAPVDDLFKGPLEEFTAARNALATKLRKSGRSEEADHIKALNKPPLSAWAVNQLFWRQRKAFDRLITTGEKFRQAQAAQLKGKAGDLRGTLEARREALSELSRLAADILRDGGHAAGPDTMRRVTTTLEALASYAGAEGAPEPGRLTGDVDPPGFEALAALVPHSSGSGSSGEPRVLQFRSSKPAKSPRRLSDDERHRQEEEERRAARAAAKAAVQAAEKTLRDARRDAERAEAALKKAAAAAKEADRARAEIETRYEKLVAAAESTKAEARRVAAEAEEAAQAVEDAERALEKANKEAERAE